MKDKVNDNTFKGKVVLLYLIHSSDTFNSIAVSNPVLEDRYGRSFIVGVVPKTRTDWASGQTVGVALDQIAHFLEFDNEQEYFDRVASAYHKPPDMAS